MKKMFRALQRLLEIHTKKSVIEIHRGGQYTKRPSVYASVTSKSGMAVVYSQPDNDRGNAQIESLVNTMSNITGLNIYDRRPDQPKAVYVAVDDPSPSAIMEAQRDLHTHYGDFSRAISIAEAHAEKSPPGIDDKSYWRHQQRVLDRICNVLAAPL